MEKEGAGIKNVCGYDLVHECCGCSACSNVCPKGCIAMERNERGFYNPVVSADCISCGRCLKVCQIGSFNPYQRTREVFGCKTKDQELILASSSGGMFSEICAAFRQMHGGACITWGAAWDEKLNVVHIMEETTRLDRLRGSKYVQSFVGSAFLEIENQIRAGKAVVFSGTACQCHSLRKYAEEKRIPTDRMLLIDIVCHGVGSPDMWDRYIELIEQKEGIHVTGYKFRNKNVAWRGFHPELETKDGIHQSKDNDLLLSYTRLYGALNLNEPCHDCKFTNLHRPGDITLGDYWGVEKAHKNLEDGKGTSICLINTSLGASVFEEAKDKILYEKVEDDSFLQPQLMHPVQRNYRNKAFWREYLTKGYDYIYRKYSVYSKAYIFFRTIYNKAKGLQ